MPLCFSEKMRMLCKIDVHYIKYDTLNGHTINNVILISNAEVITKTTSANKFQVSPL